MADCSLQTLAQLLRRTPRRIQQLASDGVLPQAEKGRYDLVKSVQAFIDYQDTLLKGQGSANLTKERERLTRAQAEKTEHELKISHGEYIHAESAAALWEKVIMDTRARLLSLPTKLAPVLSGNKAMPVIRAELEKGIYDALTELSALDPADYAHAGKAHVVAAAGASQRKRVGGRKKKAQP